METNSEKYIEAQELSFYSDLQQIAADYGFVNYVIKAKKVLTDGSNFMSYLYKATITGEADNVLKNLNLFIKEKIVPDVPLDADSAFNNETLVYRELSGVFNDLQNEFKIPLEERYKLVKYYDTNNENVIIMDDMTEQGFKISPVDKTISLKYTELALNEIAKFTALSFAIEVYRPTFYKQFINGLKSTVKNDEFCFSFLSSCGKISLMAIKDENKRKKVEKVIFDLLKTIPEKYHFREGSINCLNHNDYRPSNILYKECNGEETEVIPLDYQLISCCQPLNDFFFLILLSTDKIFREKHLEHLKEYYYDSIRKYANNYNIDIEEVYPKSSYNTDYKRGIYEFGFPNCMSLFTMFSKAKVNDDGTLDCREDFIERLNDIVDHFIEWGYL